MLLIIEKQLVIYEILCPLNTFQNRIFAA